jgi:acyl phosphate:glycerol-3-phosphate acyltransferase
VKLDIIIVFLYAYILGSIPFGLILTKIFTSKDVRNIGSGNIGATNVLRTGNKPLAALTLFFDVSKGYLSIFYTSIYFNDLIYFAALICFIGHIYPIWLKFKGGKGVAVYLGTIIFLSLECAIIFGLIWIVILFVYKYSSLSSILSTLAVSLYSILLDNINLSLYLVIAFIIMLYSHKENIVRLKNKSENKIKF